MTSLQYADDAPARMDRAGALHDIPLRLLGTTVAAAIALGIAALGADSNAILGRSSPPLGILGLPGVALLGWFIGPSVARAGVGRTLGLGLVMGLAAEPLGVITVVATLAVDSLRTAGADPASLIVGIPMLTVLGVIYGVVALVVTLPAGVAWAVATRVLVALGARLRAATAR